MCLLSTLDLRRILAVAVIIALKGLHVDVKGQARVTMSLQGLIISLPVEELPHMSLIRPRCVFRALLNLFLLSSLHSRKARPCRHGESHKVF